MSDNRHIYSKCFTVSFECSVLHSCTHRMRKDIVLGQELPAEDLLCDGENPVEDGRHLATQGHGHAV